MGAPTIIKLRVPVQFGRDAEPIAELELKPAAKHFREFTLPMKEDGTVMYQPYELAKVGLRMAGHPPAVLDLMHPADMNTVAGVVMGFLGVGPGTGSEP